MKNLFTITFFTFLSLTLYGQKKSKKKTELQYCAGITITKQFDLGDSIVRCNSCRWDECGNIINSKSDTLYKNKGIVNPDFKPLFLTVDTILLTKKDVQTLLEKNKIKHIQFFHCNDVISKIGFIALEGIYLVQLRDTIIISQPLNEAVNLKYRTKNITTSQILINGYKLYADKVKYPKYIDLNIKYLEKSNMYCVLTE
jgi:hypothetical protein